MLYAYDIKAKTKKEAEKKFRDIFNFVQIKSPSLKWGIQSATPIDI
jgi:hypothetical protein